jgi:hypothetical protein
MAYRRPFTIRPMTRSTVRSRDAATVRDRQPGPSKRGSPEIMSPPSPRTRTPMHPHADVPARRSDALDQPERHEPRSRRPDAVNVRFHGVRQRAELHGSPPSRSAVGGGLGRQQHHGPSAGNMSSAFDQPAGPWIVRLRLLPVDAEFAGSCRLLIAGAFVTMACGRCTNGFTNCCGEICVTVARPPARRRGGGTPDDRARKSDGAAAPASR